MTAQSVSAFLLLSSVLLAALSASAQVAPAPIPIPTTDIYPRTTTRVTLQNGVSAYPIKTTLTQSGKPAVADRLLIRFQAGVSDADQATIHKKAASLGAGAARSLTRISVNGYLVDVSGAASLEAAAQAYKTADARVVSAAADGLANAPAAPPDGTIGTQWHLAKIHAPDAWTFTHGAAWATIAMLDTGDDPNHPDVSPRVVGRVNVLNGSQTSDDVLAFGTLAAGVAGAIVDNGFGVDGVSYSSQLLNVKIYDDASGNALRSICLQAPTRLHASGITPTSITLAWDDNTAAEDHFEMQYKLTSDNTINSWTSVTLAANTTSWQHDGLTPGISYDHRIRACDVGSSICTDFSGLFTMVAGSRRSA